MESEIKYHLLSGDGIFSDVNLNINGTHIRKLASYGRSPGEYQNIIALTVDEGERLYFSDYGRQNGIQVANLKNGEYENPLPISYGLPKKMILAGDSLLFIVSLWG